MSIIALQIDIAKRPRGRTHQILHGNRPPIGIPNIHHRAERRVRRRRKVQERAGPRDSILPVLDIQRLPDPPHAVDHPMMQPEGRIPGADEHVPAGIAAHGVVAAAVDADRPAAGDPLHSHLEIPDILVVEEELHDGGGIGITLENRGREIALQAPRVVVKGGGLHGHSPAGKAEPCRAQVDRVIHKGPAGDAAAAGAGGEVDDRVVAQRQCDVTLVGDVCTVAGHGGVAAVEDGGGFYGVGVRGPVPVSMVMVRCGLHAQVVGACLRVLASVSTLVAQGLLKLIDEVAVPGQERSLDGLVGAVQLAGSYKRTV